MFCNFSIYFVIFFSIIVLCQHISDLLENKSLIRSYWNYKRSSTTFHKSLLHYVQHVLSCPTCLVPHVLLYLKCLMPYVLLPSMCSRASRASRASCLSGLVLYVPRALQNLLPNELSCSACLVSYVLSCRTSLVSFVLSFLMCVVPCLLLCLTWLVPCVFSRPLYLVPYVPSSFLSSFSLRNLKASYL